MFEMIKKRNIFLQLLHTTIVVLKQQLFRKFQVNVYFVF